MAHLNAESDDPPGGGFVTCPLWILTHPQLTDCDKVVLMMLDQLGWREGSRDGSVLASNEEIGRRLGKSAATIKVSIRRIASFEPPLIAIDKPSTNTRDSIRLLYDRYGQANIADRSGITLTGQILPTPASSYQKTVQTVAVEGDPDFMGRILPTASAGRILPTIPLNREDLVVVVQEGGVGQILPTPDEVNGTATHGETRQVMPPMVADLKGLLEWIPTATDDEADRKRLRRRSPHWLQRLQVRCPDRPLPVLLEWIQDAVLKGVEKKDVISYSDWILTRWVENGGRPGIEIKDPEPEVVAPADLPPVHPMPRSNGYHPRPSKAERNAVLAAERNAMIDSLFAPKENRNGSR